MAGIYGNAIAKAFAGTLVVGTDVFKAVLVKDAYTFAKEEASLVNAGAQRATGALDATCTLAAPAASGGVMTLDSTTNPVFLTVGTGQDVDAVVVHKFVTSDALSFPLTYNNFTGLPTNGSDVQVTFNVLGIATITY